MYQQPQQPPPIDFTQLLAPPPAPQQVPGNDFSQLMQAAPPVETSTSVVTTTTTRTETYKGANAGGEARKKAEGNERAEVRGKCGGHLENDKYKEGDDVHGRAAELWDFRERREEHWSDAVADDEHGQAERARDGRDSELFSQVSDAWRVDRRADVDAEGEEADVERDEALFEYGPLEIEK